MSYDIHIITRLRDRQSKYKTMVLPRRRLEKIGRRRKSTGIRFWDMGYMNGADVPYTDPQGTATWSGSGGTLSPADVALSLTNFTDRDGTILAPDPSDWTATFQQIDPPNVSGYALIVHYKSNSYTILPGSHPNWKNGALFPVDGGGSDFTVQLFPTSLSDVVDISSNKITATYDYSAPSVTFDPVPPFDVFLTPLFNFIQPRVIKTVTLSPIDQYQEYFAHAYILASRDVFLNTSNPYYSTVGVLGGLGSGGTWTIGSSSTQYEHTYYHTRWLQSLYNYRAIAEQHTGASYFYTGLSAATFASDWPAPPTMPTTTGYIQYTLQSGSNIASSPSGSLVAIIKKGSDLYYLWNV